MKKSDLSSRTVAVGVLLDVIADGQSLTRALLSATDKVDAKDLGLVKELCYGTLRWYYQLNAIASSLLNKPLKNKDQDIHILILLGLYQLAHLSIAPHAVLSQTVEAAKKLKKDWAKGLVNALLREFQRKQQQIVSQLDSHSAAGFAHPDWLYGKLKKAWPEYWQQILEANNQRPPMCLRVNKRKTDRQAYLDQLSDNDHDAQGLMYAEEGIKLTLPVSVD
jgi:16S rRNA (cytosine967-C5)-methyltransferase